jgi:hypothetical protein
MIYRDKIQSSVSMASLSMRSLNLVLAARMKAAAASLLHIKLPGLLRPVKDSLGLRKPGVYRIPCECGKVYIGQTGLSVDIMLKEHQQHVRLEHSDKSAIAEHIFDQAHRIQIHDASILATKNQTYGSHCEGDH